MPFLSRVLVGCAHMATEATATIATLRKVVIRFLLFICIEFSAKLNYFCEISNGVSYFLLILLTLLSFLKVEGYEVMG